MTGISSGPISSQPLSGNIANPYSGVVESGTAVDTFSIASRRIDNIIDIEGFEKYGPAINSNIATFNSAIANLMSTHNNQTLMRFQGFFSEWYGMGGSTGSSIGFITGRAGGSSVALCIADGSGNTTSAAKPSFGNYSRTIVGFAFVYNLGTRCGVQFNEITGGGSQLCIWFDNLGKINVSRGNMDGGTILYTSSALFLANAWHYVEIDFTIHNTAGAFTIWLDGTQVTTASSQNTRGFGSNNYWNQFIPLSRSATMGIDDIYIRDNTNGTALPFGDCTVDRLPVVADNATQFTPESSILGSRYSIQTVTTNSPGANQLILIPVTPAVNMTVNSISFVPDINATGAKFKGVIYSNNAGAPGSLLSSGTEVLGCISQQPSTLPLVTPQSLTGNTQYWIGYITDTNVTVKQSDNTSGLGQKKANTYTSGAPAGPLSGMTTGQPTWNIWGLCTNGSNFDTINKVPSPIVQTIGFAYNSSSTVGQQDTFQAGSMPIVPNQIYGLKVSVLAQKSEGGARSMNINAKSGSVNGTGSLPNIRPGTSMQWYWSIFDTDPATNGAWGPTAINLIKIGYEVAV